MKLRFVAMLVILLALIWTPCYAQGSWGATLGGGISKITASNCRIDQVCDRDNTGAFSGGVYVITPGTGMVQFEPQLLFSMKGGKASASSNKDQKLKYLEIPALARVSASLGNFKPFLVLGPSLGLRLSAKDDSGNDLKDVYHSVDLQWLLGGGAALNQRIGVEFRFQRSVSEVLTDAGRTYFGLATQPDNKVYNMSMSVMVDVGLGK